MGAGQPRFLAKCAGWSGTVNQEDMMIGFLQNIGRAALGFLAAFGRITLFTANAVRWTCLPPYYMRQFFRQVLDIGYFSLPVVGLTTLFSGMVLALQSYTGFARFSAEDTVATVVVLSVTRELGPVLAGLMVAGRIGASMAAEIGTMRVTDQIDALDTLSTRPMQYLVAPRILAGTICLPFLVLIGDLIGVFGGYIVGVYRLGFNPSIYLSRTLEYLEFSDVTLGLIKAAVFGFLIALMGCYHGYNSGRGAEGVGRATTNAVVSSSILILISNYLVTALFFG
jgi:phospholipid/cholesterol/gamma-HCH transport system permease protein